MEMKESDNCVDNQEETDNYVINVKEITETDVTETTERLLCKICNQTFSHISNLRRHVKRQHERNKEKVPDNLTKVEDDTQLVDGAARLLCKVCDQTFSHPSNLRRHEKRQHEGMKEGNHKCESCGKSFTRRGDLSRHLKTGCADLTCKTCNKVFSCIQNLRRHKKDRHGSDFLIAEGSDGKGDDGEESDNSVIKKPLFVCPVCAKEFPKESSLSGHKRFCVKKYDTKKPYCEECKKFFSDSSSLNRHVKRKHSKPTESGKMFTITNAAPLDSNTNSKDSVDMSDDDLNYKDSVDSESADSVETSDTQNGKRQHEEMKKGNLNCEKCGKLFIRRGDLSRHRSTGCTGLICNIKFSCNQNLRRHTKTLHELDFLTTEGADEHAGSIVDTQNDSEFKTDTKSDVFQCKTCNLSFPNNIAFGVHRKTHYPHRKCQLCNKTFQAGPEWLEHLKSHRSKKEDKRFCHICGNSFLSHGGFYKHMRTHAGYKVSCKLCLKTFTAAHTLKIHMLHHKGEKPYQCEICGSRFSQQSHLKRHLDSHAGHRKYQCQTCNKSFMDSSGLRTHERTHTGYKPYECNICTYKTTMHSSLKTHKKIHYLKRDFQCKICERTFTQKHALLRHGAMHENQSSAVKPGFVTKPTLFCSQCPKGFTTKRGLVRHMQKHTKGILRTVIRPEIDNGAGAKSENVSALISSVHGHYQSDNETKVCEIPSAYNDTNQAPAIWNLRDTDSKGYPNSKPSSITSINRECYAQSLSGIQRNESCNYTNEKSHDIGRYRAPDLFKENEFRGNMPQVPSSIPDINVSQNIIVATYYDYESQAEKSDGYTHLQIPVNQFGEIKVTDSANNTRSPVPKVDTSPATNISVEMDKVQNHPNRMVISENKNQAVSHPADTNLNVPADGLNTLSNVVCNLEDGTKAGWESFRFSQPLDGSFGKSQTYQNTQNVESNSNLIDQDGTVYDHTDNSSSKCEKSVISDNETIIVDQDIVQNDETLNTAEESYQNQDCDANTESTDSPQSRHLIHERDDVTSIGKENVPNGIIKEHETVTVIKLKTESLDSKRVCNVCSLSFENESSLARHTQRAHKEETEKTNVPESNDLRCKVQCLKCHEKFYSFLKFKKHLEFKCARRKSVQSKSEERNKSENENVELNATERIIINTKDEIQKENGNNNGKENKDGKYNCSYCCKSFAFLNSLKFHERKHRETASHICEICGRGFYKPYYLKRHLLLHENQTEETCFCNKCGKMFQKESVLITHMRLHMGLDPYPCTLCSKTFRHSSNLKRHLKSHVDGTEETAVVHSYYCHLCGKGYTARASLHVHLNTHNGVKPHKCTYCPASFTQVSHLKRHIKSHSGERSVKCELCEKLFYDASTLKVHMRSHTGERPYSCQLCGQSFTQIQNLKVHERKHAGVKKFKCSLCQQEFTTKMSLDRHGKRHEREGILDPEMKSKRYMTVKKMKDKTVPCPDCDRYFTTKKSMLAHRRQACSHGPEPATVGAGTITDGTENTEVLPSGTDKSEELKQTDGVEQIVQKAEPSQILENVESESADPLTQLQKKRTRDEPASVEPNTVNDKYEEYETVQISEEINEEIYDVNQVPTEEIQNSETSEQVISSKRQSYHESEPYIKLQRNDGDGKTYAYPSRTVIFYNEPGGSTIASRKEHEIDQRTCHEPVRVSSRNEQYEAARNVHKQANKIKHSGRCYDGHFPVERKIHESVDNIAESMVSFMQDKNNGRTFTDIADSPRIRIYPRDISSSNQAASFIEDGSEMSIVHVVEDAPYTEIVIEDVPDHSRVEHSSLVQGYSEPVRFSHFPSYTSHASNNPLTSSIPTPPGSFSVSTTPQSNVITPVFAPGVLGVPLNLVTLGPMSSVPMEQTSQEQYFHQEPQWRMPCP